jgi:hypothetical protein
MNKENSTVIARGYDTVDWSDAKQGLLAWGCYRSSKIANFTREVHDFPNATISISVGPSAGWVEQLAGITNVSVGVASGPDINGKIGVNEVVGTGLFFEGQHRITFGQCAQVVTGLVGGPVLRHFAGHDLYPCPDMVTVVDNAQQITMFASVGAGRLAQSAVERGYSLNAQLLRLCELPTGWDDEAAQTISKTTRETAEEVIKAILQISLRYMANPTILLGPLPDGTLRFDSIHANKELFLTISEKAIEVQSWQPRDAVESLVYLETDAAGAREYLEWLVK